MRGEDQERRALQAGRDGQQRPLSPPRGRLAGRPSLAAVAPRAALALAASESRGPLRHGRRRPEPHEPARRSSPDRRPRLGAARGAWADRQPQTLEGGARQAAGVQDGCGQGQGSRGSGPGGADAARGGARGGPAGLRDLGRTARDGRVAAPAGRVRDEARKGSAPLHFCRPGDGAHGGPREGRGRACP